MPPPPSLERLLEHRRYVRDLARRMAPDLSAADDIEQEAWASILRRPPAHDRGLKTWLSLVVRTVSTNRRTADQRREFRERRAARPEAVHSDLGSDFEDFRTRLRSALGRLPESSCEIIRLRYFEGLSVREIAEEIGAPPATVYTRLRRSLQQLRCELDEAYGDRRIWSAYLLALGALTPRRSAGLAVWGGLAVGGAALIALSWLNLWPDNAGNLQHARARSAATAPSSSGALTETEGARTTVVSDLPRADRECGIRIVARWSDGSPAQGVGILLEARGSNRYSPPVQGVLDASGTIVFEGLEPETWEVFSTSTARAVVNASAGGIHDIVWELGSPREMAVHVRGLAGSNPASWNPVPAIHLSVPGDAGRLIDMGPVGADSSRVLSHFEPDSWVMAVRANEQASPMVSLDHPGWKVGTKPSVALRLSRGSQVKVHVLDPAGRPVVGARVKYGNLARFPAPTRADGLREFPTVFQALTGPDGTCAVFATGSEKNVLLRVVHDDFAPFIEFLDRMEKTYTVELTQAARVEGRVVDRRGGTLAGARILWRQRWRNGEVQADDGGVFALDGLGDEPIQLMALHGQGEQTRITHGTLQPVAGTVSEWSPILSPAPLLRGLALDADGSPLSGAWVALIEPLLIARSTELVNSEPPSRWARVGTGGEFAFPEWRRPQEAGSRSLCVYAERAWGKPLGWMDDPPFASADVLIGPRFTGAPAGRILVQVDGAEALDEAAEVFLRSPRSPPRIGGVRAGSSWSFDGLVPGDWSVIWAGTDSIPVPIETVALEVGETVELAFSAHRPPGRFDVRVFEVANRPAQVKSVDLVGLGAVAMRESADRRRPSPCLEISGDSVRGEVPPGMYRLEVRCRNGLGSLRLRVQPEEITRADLQVLAGKRQTFDVRMKVDLMRRLRELSVQFLAEDGEVLLEASRLIRSHQEVQVLAFLLPDGVRRIRGRVTCGGESTGWGEAPIPPEFTVVNAVELDLTGL